MIFAIDFDGVIHDYKNIPEGRKLGAPIEGAKEALEFLRSERHKIIIFSTWASEDKVKTFENWLNYFEIPFDEITNIKQKAHFYIDDHGLRFSSWNDTLLQINKLIS